MSDKNNLPASELLESLRALPPEEISAANFDRSYNFFSVDGPDLKNLIEVNSLVEFFGVNWRNIFLLGLYIMIFLALTFFALRGVTQGFKVWASINILGWLIVAFPFCGICLSSWRLVVEEMIRLPYHKDLSLYAEFKLSKGKIVDFSWPVRLGGRLASRRIIWEDPSTGFTGVSPYLPGPTISRLNIGSEIWIAVDPKNRFSPLLVGAKK